MTAVTRRSTLEFEHASPEEIRAEGRQETETVLRDLCRTTKEDIRPETPQLFSSLVAAVKKLSSDDLREIFAKMDATCSNNNKPK